MIRIWMAAVMAAGLALQAGAGEAGRLFPVVKDGKWGYMDGSGKVAIAPQYEAAWDFSEGLAAVQVGLLRGYIDEKGAVAIKPQFAQSGPFRCGLAAALVGAERWGNVMDSRGGGRWVYIDRTGKIALDPKGKRLMSADDFQEGEARVSFEFNVHERFSTINTNGAIREFKNTFPGRFSEGLAAWELKPKVYGYMDHAGKMVITNQYQQAGEFVDGLAPVMKDKKWGYIGKTGEPAFEGTFEDARSFSEGLASVKVNGKWGCIDKTGKTVVNPEYDFAAPFAEGLARVVKAGPSAGSASSPQAGSGQAKNGYIDKTGKVVVDPKFDGGWEFSGGLARIVVDGKEGYIDKTGKTVWEPSK